LSRQPEVFPAAFRAKRNISRRAYTLFGLGAFLMALGGIILAIAFAFASQPNPVLVIFAILSLVAGLASLIVAALNLASLQQSIQVEVDPHRLIWREGKRTATLEFAEVERVIMVKDYRKFSEDFTMTYPVVRFIENDGEMMEFEVAFEDRGYTHPSRFDTRGITQSVLRHLRSRSKIDISPAVDEFVRAGVIDVDQLPDR